MNEEGNIIVNKDGVDVSVYAIGSFEQENGKEYLIYHFENEDDIHVSRILENKDGLNLCEITDEEFALAQEVIDSILEGNANE